MGSFANSLHVRSDDADAVSGEICQILENRGFRPAEDSANLDVENLDPSIRAFRVSEARDGWGGSAR